MAPIRSENDARCVVVGAVAGTTVVAVVVDGDVHRLAKRLVEALLPLLLVLFIVTVGAGAAAA